MFLHIYLLPPFQGSKGTVLLLPSPNSIEDGSRRTVPLLPGSRVYLPHPANQMSDLQGQGLVNHPADFYTVTVQGNKNLSCICGSNGLCHTRGKFTRKRISGNNGNGAYNHIHFGYTVSHRIFPAGSLIGTGS